MLYLSKVFLFSVVLHQVVSSLYAPRDVETKPKLEQRDNSFPPKTPITIELHTVRNGDALLGIWIELTIGNEEYSLDFDTGSDISWVLSTINTTPEYEECNKYPFDASQGCDKAVLQYLDSSRVSGFFTTDTVALSTSERANFKFVAASRYKTRGTLNICSNFGLDGLFGAANFAPTDDEAGAWLSGTSFTVDVRDGQPSSVTFGNLNPTAGSRLPLVPHSSNEWLVYDDALEEVLFDSGVVSLWLPKSFLDTYFKGVDSARPSPNGQGTWRIDCSEDLPDLVLRLGGLEFTIPGKTLKIPAEEFRDDTGMCGAYLHTADGQTSIMGLPFFRQAIITFDGPNRQIWLLKK